MRLCVPTVVMGVLTLLSGCGEQEPAEEETVTPITVAQPPAAAPQQPQVPGFGPLTIRAMGTTSKPAFGTVYVGDCDGAQPDDDFEVMTFSAPWKIVGQSSGGNGARFGGPTGRSFYFEKNPDAAELKLELDFGLERTDLTAGDLTAGHQKVTDLAFSPGSVGLYRVKKPDDPVSPYMAVFPLIDREGMPQEPGFTGRYIATVTLLSTSLPEFEGWRKEEIIQLFESFYAARCLGEGLEQGWAALAPTLIFE